MKVQKIMIICIVLLGISIIVQSDRQVEDGFRNLLDSIATNDSKNSRIYHTVLKQELAKKRHAFSAMKEEIRIARNKNSFNRRNFNKRSNMGEKSVEMIKRQINNETTPSSAVSGVTSVQSGNRTGVEVKSENATVNPYERDVEDKYIDYFGNERFDRRPWDLVRDWFYKNSVYHQDLEPVKKYCEAVHRAAGRGRVTVDRVLLKLRELRFTNDKYDAQHIDVLSYGIAGVTKPSDGMDKWYMVEGPHGYITEGRRPDCVYYLNLVNRTHMLFHIHEYVCGIQI